VTAPVMQLFMQIFIERLTTAGVAGVILAALVWTSLRIFGHQNAGTRFAIWFSALLAIVFFPFLSAGAFRYLPFGTSAADSAHSALILAPSWALYFFVAWSVGAALFAVRLAAGLWRMRALRKNCTEVDTAALGPAVANIVHTLSGRRSVSLCTSKDLAVPAALGLFRPAVVFPEKLFSQLSGGEIEMIVRHELAHLGRWDDWTNVIQKLVKAIFFFHPAVWWIENRLGLEREMACDDVVLAQTASPRAYASSLISFAEKLHCARGLAMAQALVSRVHQMSARVAQILDSKRPGHTGVKKPAVAMSAGLLIAAFAAVPYMPRLIAFRSQANQQTEMLLSSSGAASAGRSVAVPSSLRRNLNSSSKVIPAGFHPHRSSHPRLLKAEVPHVPLVLRTRANQTAPVIEETIFILRQSPDGLPASPRPAGWALCVWTWTSTTADGHPVQSAILVRWI